MKLDSRTAKGYYARKQLGSRSRLIAWAHRRRFVTGLRLARRFAGKRVLDFGSGDGTFLALLMAGPDAPAEALGVDIAEDAVRDCQERLGDIPGLEFAHVRTLESGDHDGTYDGIICTEVLEHVVELPAMLDRLARLLAPDGTLLVSVPVEVGLPVIVKQAVRRVLGWRGIGDYPGVSPYTIRELLASLFAGSRQHITRPLHRVGESEPFHDHKGFNWMVLRSELRKRLAVDRVSGSPVPGLTPHLASQAWFLASRPPAWARRHEVDSQ